MTTNEAVRTRYSDILEEGDDAVFLEMISDIEATLPRFAPSSALYVRLGRPPAGTVNSSERRHRAFLPTRIPLRNRSQAVTAAVVLAGAVGSMGATGFASATVRVVTAHLFSAPPPALHRAVWVGSLAIPLKGGCAPDPATSPVMAPDHRRIAEFGTAPADYSQSVAATFPPCTVSAPPPGAAPAPHQPPGLAWENVTDVSIIRYRGNAGTVSVTTARATDKGMSRGLYLGNADGALSDGTPRWVLGNEVRWVKDDLIVSVSGDTSIERLNALASDVVLR